MSVDPQEEKISTWAVELAKATGTPIDSATIPTPGANRQRPSGPPPPPPRRGQVQKSPTPPTPATNPLAELGSRHMTCRQNLQTARLAGFERKQVERILQKALEHVASGDPKDAEVVISRVEKFLAATAESHAGRIALLGKLWRDTQKDFTAETNQIEKAILAWCRESPIFPAVARKMPLLHASRKTFGAEIEATLADKKKANLSELRDALEEQSKWIVKDPVLVGLEANPFRKSSIRTDLLATLKKLEAKAKEFEDQLEKELDDLEKGPDEPER